MHHKEVRYINPYREKQIVDNYREASKELYDYKVQLEKYKKYTFWSHEKVEWVIKSLDEWYPHHNGGFRNFENKLWDLLDIYRVAKKSFGIGIFWVPELYELWWHKMYRFYEARCARTTPYGTRFRSNYIQKLVELRGLFAEKAEKTFDVKIELPAEPEWLKQTRRIAKYAETTKGQ